MAHFNDRFCAWGAAQDYSDASFVHQFLRHRWRALRGHAKRWTGDDGADEALSTTLQLLVDPGGPRGRWWTPDSDMEHASGSCARFATRATTAATHR